MRVRQIGKPTLYVHFNACTGDTVSRYGKGFYSARDSNTRESAEKILALLMARLPPINSAIDVGCGVGTWLAALRRSGIIDVQGIEGPWVRHELLEIPREQLFETDMSALLSSGDRWPRRYDLAISLEVAEHLPARSASDFVGFLCDAADFILFSAASPHQGGRHHVNEQWPEYWAELFEERGYRYHDWVRPQIWKNRDIPVWYRQNMLVFIAQTRECDVEQESARCEMPLAVVHPEMYESKMERPPFQQRLRRTLRHLLSR